MGLIFGIGQYSVKSARKLFEIIDLHSIAFCFSKHKW